VVPESEGSSPRSWEPATGPYPEPGESTKYPLPQPISLRFILIPSSYLCLGLLSGVFPLHFPTKTKDLKKSTRVNTLYTKCPHSQPCDWTTAPRETGLHPTFGTTWSDGSDLQNCIKNVLNPKRKIIFCAKSGPLICYYSRKNLWLFNITTTVCKHNCFCGIYTSWECEKLHIKKWNVLGRTYGTCFPPNITVYDKAARKYK
jgi:hypothetical protein